MSPVNTLNLWSYARVKVTNVKGVRSISTATVVKKYSTAKKEVKVEEMNKFYIYADEDEDRHVSYSFVKLVSWSFTHWKF